MAGSGQIHAWSDCALYIRDKKDTRIGNIPTVDLKIEVETKYTPTNILAFRNIWEADLWNPEAMVSDIAEVVFEENRGRGRKLNTLKYNKTKTYLKKNPDASLRTIGEAVGITPGTANKYKKMIQDEEV